MKVLGVLEGAMAMHTAAIGKILKRLRPRPRVGIIASWSHNYSSSRVTHAQPAVLFAVGSNVNGALGTGSTTREDSPKRVVLIGNDDPSRTDGPSPDTYDTSSTHHVHLKNIACGWGHSAAVTNDGRVFMWGRTHDVQQVIRFERMERNSPMLLKLFEMLGSNTSIDALEPQEVVLPEGSRATDIKCGGGLTAILTNKGEVMCLGANMYGQCGIGTRNLFQYYPVPVKGFERGDDKVIQIGVGFRHCVALTAKGSVYTWGKGNRGQIGKGSSAAMDSLEAQKVVAGDLAPCVNVTAGFNHCLALQKDGIVKTWGKFQRRNTAAAEESGGQEWVQFSDSWVPTIVQFPNGVGKVKRIWSGLNHNVAQTEDDAFYQWGRLSDMSIALAEEVNAQVKSKQDPDPRPLGDLSRFTVHMPVKVDMRPDIGKFSDLKIHAGFDKTYLISSMLDAPLVWDWGLKPISLPLVEPDLYDFCAENNLQNIAPGWRHRLFLATPKLS